MGAMNTSTQSDRAQAHAPAPSCPPGTAGSLGRLRESIAIRRLSERHRPQILEHLMQLSTRDRYLRFGYTASDEQVVRYVASLNFERDELHGVFNRDLALVAVAHLALPLAGHAAAIHGTVNAALGRCAEFGVSVLTDVRGQHLGSRLYAHAARAARVHGLDHLFIHALTENAAMLRIARRHGARVERYGSESEAYLKLPPADVNTHVQHLLQEQWAHLDYGVKAQQQQWREWLAVLQETREDMREGRHRSGA